jgi:hypothetical protein
VAPIQEIQLFVPDADGKPTDVTFQELGEKLMGARLARIDLQISRSRDGELYITSRQDGMIRTFVRESTPATR